MRLFETYRRIALRAVILHPRTSTRYLIPLMGHPRGLLLSGIRHLEEEGVIIRSGRGWRTICFGEPLYMDGDIPEPRRKPVVNVTQNPYRSLKSRVKTIAARRTA